VTIRPDPDVRTGEETAMAEGGTALSAGLKDRHVTMISIAV
jgi:hypothetical protein